MIAMMQERYSDDTRGLLDCNDYSLCDGEKKVFGHSSAHARELLYERLNKAGLDSKLVRELSILDVCWYTRRPQRRHPNTLTKRMVWCARLLVGTMSTGGG